MKKIHTYIMACLITACHFSYSIEPYDIETDALSLLIRYEAEMGYNADLQYPIDEDHLMNMIGHRLDDYDDIYHVIVQMFVLFF